VTTQFLKLKLEILLLECSNVGPKLTNFLQLFSVSSKRKCEFYGDYSSSSIIMSMMIV